MKLTALVSTLKNTRQEHGWTHSLSPLGLSSRIRSSDVHYNTLLYTWPFRFCPCRRAMHSIGSRVKLTTSVAREERPRDCGQTAALARAAGGRRNNRSERVSLLINPAGYL